MNSGVPHQAFEPAGNVDQFADLYLILIRLLQRGRIGQCLINRDIQSIRHHFGDAIYIAVRNIHRAANIFDCGFRSHGSEGDNLRDLLASVFTRHVVDDFAPPIHAEVNVDIRHRDAFRIQESLEEQFVLQRINVRDPHSKRH